MPSCVVRCCKHNTSLQKKASGITFHLFPKEPSRRKKWIQIVRRCRNEEYWLPSNHSRICSSHFDNTDFYTSECGLYRLNRDATPKKALCESDSTMDRETKVKVEISIDEEAIKIDPSDIEGDDNLDISQHVELNQYHSIGIDRVKPEPTYDSKIWFDVSKVKIEEPSSNHIETPPMYENPAELRNQIILLRQKLDGKRKHIIVLNQKVRRLTKSNERLKNTLMGVKNKLILKSKFK